MCKRHIKEIYLGNLEKREKSYTGWNYSGKENFSSIIWTTYWKYYKKLKFYALLLGKVF